MKKKILKKATVENNSQYLITYNDVALPSCNMQWPVPLVVF
jgi:hypothetical protein